MSISGAKEMDALLKKLPEKMARKALEDAVRFGANIIRKEARNRAPVYSGPERRVKRKGKIMILKPGNLKRSIMVRKIKGGQYSVTYGIGPSKAAFYAHMVEFGTTKASAKPFMRPAFDSKYAEALDRMGKKLAQTLTREAEKLASKGRKRLGYDR